MREVRRPVRKQKTQRIYTPPTLQNHTPRRSSFSPSRYCSECMRAASCFRPKTLDRPVRLADRYDQHTGLQARIHRPISRRIVGSPAGLKTKPRISAICYHNRVLVRFPSFGQIVRYILSDASDNIYSLSTQGRRCNCKNVATCLPYIQTPRFFSVYMHRGKGQYGFATSRRNQTHV